jgi:hypothetical protein
MKNIKTFEAYISADGTLQEFDAKPHYSKYEVVTTMTPDPDNGYHGLAVCISVTGDKMNVVSLNTARVSMLYENCQRKPYHLGL